MSDTPETKTKPAWRALDPTGLQQRLLEIRHLLEQARAVGLAQDAKRLESMATLAKHEREGARSAHPGFRRYR